MSSSRPVQVAVEIRPTDETISGSVRVEDGVAWTFFGWLELIDLLQRAVDPQGSDRGGDPAR